MYVYMFLLIDHFRVGLYILKSCMECIESFHMLPHSPPPYNSPYY